MSDSAESVVRRFHAAWSEPKTARFSDFFDDNAIWVDGPQGVRRGAAAIVDELTRQLAVGRGYTVEIDTLVSDKGTVMVEWHGGFTIGGEPITCAVMATLEIENGRITQWRESYDLKSVTDQIAAAGFKVPG